MFSSSPPPAAAGETSRIKSFMGRTPTIGILKSKFLTVLGNSNELLNGISSKLTLNISSSDSDYCDDDEEVPKYDESIDYTKIDYESRRVKARRAHEEIISGRYRQPNLAPRPRLDALRNRKAQKSRSSSSSSSSSSSTSTSSRSFNGHAQARSHMSSTTRSNSIESRHSGGYERHRAIPGARRSELDMQRDLMRPNDIIKPPTAGNVVSTVAPAGGGLGLVNAGNAGNTQSTAPHIEVQSPHERDPSKSSTVNAGLAGATSNHSMRVPPVRRKNSNSSTLTSLRDDLEYQVSPSNDSTDWRNFIRSESQNSVPSWASSISLDCRAGEEPIKEFMKRFVDTLFVNAAAIDLELKSEFGAMARLEIGRQWFVRFLLQQKNKTKRVEELTFHSLIQHFALVLFECNECQDFSPAYMIMNMSFLFYREIEVPGCDPYREYLCTFMREQPIWLSPKFWNAAFVECMESERNSRVLARQKKQERRKAKEKATKEVDEFKAVNVEAAENEEKPMGRNEISDSSSSHNSRGGNKPKKERPPKAPQDVAAELEKEMENIAFRQLASFTCNIHTLGAPQSLCLDFFKKQHSAYGLGKDKSKLIRDNINRIYYETEIWGSKQS